MNIRKFREGDRELLIELWRMVFPDDPPHNEPALALDAKLAVDDLIFVAEHEGNLIGACMAGYDGHRGWLYLVAVLEDRRRNGTGTLLAKHALASLKELGCIKVNLQLRAGNSVVAAFYKSAGFIIEERLSMGLLLNE